MSINYTYSILQFNNLINTGSLHNIIHINDILLSKFQYIETNDDVVDIWFNDTLNQTELAELTSIIESYTHVTDYSNNKLQIFPMLNNNKTSNTMYIKLSNFLFDPINSGMITKIIISSYKDINVASYMVRLYNITESNIIAEGIFVNNIEDINDLGTIINTPTKISNIEIQLKKIGMDGINVYLNSVSIYSI